MKKVFLSLIVMGLMLTSSALVAQEAEAKLEAEAAVAEASSPAEEVAPAAADLQGSVSDGVALGQAEVPMIPAASSDVIFDAGVISGGGFVDVGCGQAFAPSSCCQPSCCDPCGQASFQPSFVEPVVFNQPIVQEAVPAIQASASSIVTAAPAPAAIYSQPITSGCSSCSGGGVVNYSPAPAASYSPAPAASYPVAAGPVVSSYAPVSSSYAAPVEASYAAPAVSSGCSSCAGAVSYAPSPCSNCPPSNRFRRGISTRLGGAVLGRLIRDN